MSMRIVRSPDAFNTSRRAKEAIEVRDERHLAWIRTLPSVISGLYGCEAAHVSYADRRYGKPERAKGKKTGDDFTLPLTPDEHQHGPDAQHKCKSGGEREWWMKHGIDATALASRLWAVSGDTDAGLEVISQARLDAAAALRRIHR